MPPNSTLLHWNQARHFLSQAQVSKCWYRGFKSSSSFFSQSSSNTPSSSSDTSRDNATPKEPSNEPPGLHSTADAKDLILSVLRSTATKREARQYISRYLPLIGRDKDDILKRRQVVQELLKDPHKSTERDVFDGKKVGEHLTNQGLHKEAEGLEFGDNQNEKVKAGTSSALQSLLTNTQLFKKSDSTTATSNNTDIPLKHVLRVAIIKIRDIKSISPQTILNLGETIVRLSKLGVSPIVVVDAGKERHDFLNLDNKPFAHYERAIMWKAAAIAGAIETASVDGSVRARPVEGLFELIPNAGDELNTNASSTNANTKPITSSPLKHYTHVDTSMATKLKLSIPSLLLSPLSHDIIPVVVPLAYDPSTCEEKLIVADDSVIFLVSELTKTYSSIASVEKIVFIDPLGGIPSIERSGAHVYVNLSQELNDIFAELHLGFVDPTTREINLANLRAMDQALTMLPSTATGLITSPEVAALSDSQNPVIYNILTDRPILSPSLPVVRDRTKSISTTILRKGMPVLMMKSVYGIDLVKESKVGTIDLTRLWDLIEDSFGRKLDVEKYLKRINKKVAGIVIAGDYEGAAIITWEDPPIADDSQSSSSSSQPTKPPIPSNPIVSEFERICRAADNNAYNNSHTHNSTNKRYRRIPYLDKFAVRSSSQGAAGVADVIFKSMAMTLFPDELLWRSRKNNPVNKWYFERSRGTLKMPEGKEGSKWCVFWTGNHTREKEKLNEYVKICQTIPDSWKN